MTRYLSRVRPLSGALALVVGLTFAAPPAFAAEPVPEPTPTPAPTLAEAAEAAVEALPASTLAQAAEPAPNTNESLDKPFMKSKKGIAAVVLMVAGLGIMAYAMNNDRVKSPAK